ncbi:MAG: WhiB family transcriptional regulator [Propionicimonas sp.]
MTSSEAGPRRRGCVAVVDVPVDWRDVASCRDDPDPDAWFTIEPHRLRAALQVCRGCSVLGECAESGRGDDQGVWGGHAHGQYQRDVLAGSGEPVF